MKSLLALILVLVATLTYSQKTSKKLSVPPEKIKGFVSNEYIMNIDLEKNDTVLFVYNGFQNAKYTTITDVGSIAFFDQETLDKFISDVEKCLPLLDEKGSNIKFDRETYDIYIYDFMSGVLYVSDEDGKYTTLSKKNVLKWIAWLKTIKFPSGYEAPR